MLSLRSISTTSNESTGCSARTRVNMRARQPRPWPEFEWPPELAGRFKPTEERIKRAEQGTADDGGRTSKDRGVTALATRTSANPAQSCAILPRRVIHSSLSHFVGND